MSEGLFRGIGSPAGRPQSVHYGLMRKVRDSPVNLTRLKNAIVPGAAVGARTEGFDPEVPEIPKLNCQGPVPASNPALKHSIGRQEEAFAVPLVWCGHAGRQQIWRGVENRPLCLVLRAVNDHVLLGLIRALAPTASADDAIRRADQVAIIQIEQQHVFRLVLHPSVLTPRLPIISPGELRP